jgi:E-phenylitaconyl-CoA hydratase
MTLLYEKEARVVIITLNRPETLNALDQQTYQEFSEACLQFRDDPEAWVAIITGSGDKAFCAGADLKKSIPLLLDGNLEIPPSIRRGLRVYKPFIAAVNGIAAGGGLEITLACDIRIASESATFTVAEPKLGLMPGQGCTQRLPRIIGLAGAAEMMFMAKTIDAHEAFRIGLVNAVVPHKELKETALEWAQAIARNGPLAIKSIKKALTEGFDLPLDKGLELEDSLVKALVSSEDVREGLTAFMEKRTPVFKGR